MAKKHKNNSRAILVIVTVAVAISGILYFGWLKPKVINTAPGGTSSLIIDYGNDRKRQFEGPVVKDMTVLTALLASRNGGDIDMRYSANGKGALILNSINGHINNIHNKHWVFYLNGSLVDPESIGEIKISPGDLIMVKYE